MFSITILGIEHPANNITKFAQPMTTKSGSDNYTLHIYIYIYIYIHIYIMCVCLCVWGGGCCVTIIVELKILLMAVYISHNAKTLTILPQIKDK